MFSIPLQLIDPNPWQTRLFPPDPAYIRELGLSIAANGLLQMPLGRVVDGAGRHVATLDLTTFHNGELVPWLEANRARVQLAFGHNRLAAFTWLKEVGSNSNIAGDYSDMPVDLRSLTDEQMADYAWDENERRRGVDPISRAKAVQRRIQDFGWTHDQAAEHLGMKRPSVTNLLRLLDLPVEIQGKLMSDELSIRQADALLTLFALPEEIRNKGEQQWDAEIKPSAIVRDALAGESSDGTRARAKKLIDLFSEKLNNVPWSLSQVFAEHPDMLAPACDGCSARVNSGNWKYCLGPTCYRRRLAAWQQAYLEKASAACGVPVLDAGKSQYDIHDFTGWRQESEDLKAILSRKERCENLRLAYVDYLGKEGVFHPDGFEHARIVCNKKRQFCTCQNGLNAARELAKRAAQQPAAPSNNRDAPAQPDSPTVSTVPTGKPLSQVFEEQDLEALARQARAEKRTRQLQVKTLRRGAAEVIARAISENHRGAWYLILRRVQADAPESATLADLQMGIAEKIVENGMSFYADDDDPERALGRINTELQKTGLPLLAPDGSLSQTPDVDNPAARLANRWERIASWMANLDQRAPTYQAVKGNIDNLVALDEDLGELVETHPETADDPLITPLLQAGEDGESSPISVAIERLYAVLEAVDRPDWNKVSFDDIGWLCHTPEGDANFSSTLERAGAPTLAYTLALISGLPNHGTRAGKIRARLNKLEKQEASHVPPQQ